MALYASGKNISSPAIQKGLDYIRDHQTISGGFTSWGSTNTATTAWVLCALSTLDIDPLSGDWMQGDNSSVSYLLSMQQSDGSFSYSKDTSLDPTWTTAYALISLSGKSFIINS
jgi:prenyltransferase beta subunit